MSKLPTNPNYIQMSKDKHKLINWGAYNEGLKQRGGINIWINEEMLRQWNQAGKSGKRGRQKKYNDLAILCCLVVRKVYHLPLRQCEGLVSSFFKMMGISMSVPDYTTLCRRASMLEIQLNQLERKGQVVDIAIDSTGLKVYGEGEWKVRKHGWNKYRTWMKLHVGIDTSSQQIAVSALTTHSVDDAEPVKAMLEEVLKDKEIKSFVGDGAYDKEKVYKQLSEKEILPIIPTQHNAKKSKKNKPWLQSRDKTIEEIKQWGKKEWKKRAGYHKRSLAETVMYRYKTIIGDKLKSRKQNNQATEIKISCLILNKMLLLAKPVSIKVT